MFLSKALTSQPDGLWAISETRGLPAEAKPAELREDIAAALEHASGSWVMGYVVEALAREDRSNRCRIELCRQLAIRDRNLGRWIENLNAQQWSDFLESGSAYLYEGGIAENNSSCLDAHCNLRTSNCTSPGRCKHLYWTDMRVH